MRILVVEDDNALRDQLEQILVGAGYACDTAADGEEGLFFALEYPVDLAIIDIGLPGKNGVDLIREIREKQINYPVLILTARDGWQDKVNGLEAGADDYLVKPFQKQELLARLNALLRRSSGFSSPRLTFGSISLDTAAQRVSINGSALDLTAYEYRVMECLALNVGKVLSKTVLTEHIYAEDAEHDSNVIEVFIGRLRKKIRDQGVDPRIETVRGQGYRFNADEIVAQ